MKKIIVFAALFLSSLVGFCQDASTKKILTGSEYLKKSKSQKTAAFILLGAGIGLIAIASSGDASFNSTEVLVIGGGIAALSSIPLFIAAGKNKRKAHALSAFKFEHNDNFFIHQHITAAYPAVALQLKL